MKFYCDNCQAKYAISDEKVRGKVLKVRCKSCDHVITVREPRAPAASSVGGLRGLPPSAPSRAAWHYAINGKSFGPYDETALALMFESGEIGDAAYVWRESFGADWKPARDLPQFAAAINKGSALRPRNKTIGISAALSAVNIDARPEERDEEEGFVPGQDAASAPDGLDKRMEGLRDRLKQHNAPSPEAKRNPFAPAPASNTPAPEQEEGADATSQMDRGQINAMLGIGANAPEMPDTQPEPFAPEPTFEQAPEPDLADQLFGEDDGAEADFSSGDGDGGEDLYSFGGVAAGGESSIDFSKLSSPSEMQSSDFAEGELVVDKEIKKQDEDGGFQVSNSLLIQMGDIQKQGRGKRVMAGIGIVAFLAVVGTVAVITAKNTKKKAPEQTNTVFEPQKKELVFKTYAKDELGIVFELEEGEEILTVEDSKAIAEEMEAEEAKIAKNGGKKPRVVAENTRPNKKPGIDDPGLRGVNMGNLLTKKSGLDSALEESKAGSKGSEKGLATAGSDNGKGTALGTKDASKKGGPDWDAMKSTRPNNNGGVSALDRIRTNDSMGKGQTKPTGPKLGDAGVLSKDAAKAGFKKVRRSVQLCHQRQTSRGLPLSSAKVHITVEIQGTGNVSGVKLEPASFKHSVFETCMQEQQRRGRWRFEAYGGKTVKIKHTYVLQ